jgi:hypothetical protein
MRAKEFVTESRAALSVDIARAMPGTYTIPGLPNSDFYKQYRFGVALAGARGQLERVQDSIPAYNFEKETPWGENMIVSSYMDGEIEKDIDYAMRETGVPGTKVLISTKKSEEAPGVDKISPIKAFKGYPK